MKYGDYNTLKLYYFYYGLTINYAQKRLYLKSLPSKSPSHNSTNFLTLSHVNCSDLFNFYTF